MNCLQGRTLIATKTVRSLAVRGPSSIRNWMHCLQRTGVRLPKRFEPDPQQRWPSCLDFIRALEESETDDHPGKHPKENALHEIIGSQQQPPMPPSGGNAEELQKVLSDLIALAGGIVPEDDAFGLPQLLESGVELRQKFRVGSPIGTARQRLDGYRQQLDGQVIFEDEQGYEFLVAVPTNFLQQWIGWQPGLEFKVQLTRPHALSATPIDVTVTVKAVRCGKIKAAQIFRDLGANLLEGLRLLVGQFRKTHVRSPALAAPRGDLRHSGGRHGGSGHPLPRQRRFPRWHGLLPTAHLANSTGSYPAVCRHQRGPPDDSRDGSQSTKMCRRLV